MWPAPADPGYANVPRLRLGFFGWAGIGATPTPGAGAVGLGLRLGAQINDTIGVYAQVYGTSLAFLGVGDANVMVDFTVNDWFTAGTGFGGGAAYSTSLLSSGSSSLALGVPVRVAFNIGGAQRTTVMRHRFTISLDGFFGGGSASGSNAIAFAAYGGLGLGYEIT